MTNDALQLPLSVKEAAELMRCSPSAVLKEIKRGNLKAAHKKGRTRYWFIKREWLKEYADTVLEEI